ncbi:MAG: DUF1007 family protein [Hyphomicrobiaceae bacterium]|nr:DUF1007 family protein [Hyphomicrobiaceae bacterium]
MNRRRTVLATLACLAPALIAASPATAHPHVWVSVEATVIYDKGSIVGLAQKWTFDEMYTTMAIQGLDQNGDGVYDRKELAELAQVNIDGLTEFDYFTFPRLGDAALKIDAPKDYWLEHANGVLSLHVTTPLAQPVLAEAQGFSVAIYDPSYFIAFDLAEKEPVRLSAGAPSGCVATVGVPKQEADVAQQLSDAFNEQLGGPTGAASDPKTATMGDALGLAVTKTIAVSCPRT